MNMKKYVENRIRGWLPKEPNMGRRKFSIKWLNVKIQRKPPTLNDRLVGGLGGAGGTLVLLGILHFFWSPGFPRPFIFVEELIGILLLAIAFLVWVIDKNKKPSVKNDISTL